MIVTAISYCSREKAYIGQVIRNAVQFSEIVVVSIGTRLYDGTPEPVEQLFAEDVLGALETDQERAKVHLATYGVPAQIPKGRHTSYLHNTARMAGVRVARAILGACQSNFWILFLDADEVPDAPAFQTWLADPRNKARLNTEFNTMFKFANYWAFIHPKLVSVQNEDSVLMAHNLAVHKDAVMHPRERDGLYLWDWEQQRATPDIKVERDVPGLDKTPMFWHYSWVREVPLDCNTDIKEEWLEKAEAGIRAKIRGWGHQGDRDWNAVISHTFTKMRETKHWPEREFVHGHALKLVAP